MENMQVEFWRIKLNELYIETCYGISYVNIAAIPGRQIMTAFNHNLNPELI